MTELTAVPLKVTPLAYTTVRYVESTKYLSLSGDGLEPELKSDADYLAEFAGRACYQAWNRPNPKTRKNEDYLQHIIQVGHFSVLEHASATFYIEGVSRTCTHQIVRHRHFNYSQLSQRYVDQSTIGYVVPPAIRKTAEAMYLIKDNVEHALVEYKRSLDTIQKVYPEAKRKEMREAARAVLPGCMETKLVMTGNHRAWRDFLSKRLSPAADAEIREVAQALLTELKKIAPNTYYDLELQ